MFQSPNSCKLLHRLEQFTLGTGLYGVEQDVVVVGEVLLDIGRNAVHGGRGIDNGLYAQVLSIVGIFVARPIMRMRRCNDLWIIVLSTANQRTHDVVVCV